MRRHCNLSGRCGGCTYANIPYADELLDKRVMEEKLLGRFSDVAPILQSGRITGYRCKVQAVCGMDDGRLVTGIYRKGTHKLIPVRSCPLEDERAGRILETIRSLCTRFGIIAYDEDMGFGDLRHVLIRLAAHNDEALVTLVTASDRLPHEADLAAAIHQKHPFVKGVVSVKNREKTSMVIPENPEMRIIYGKGYITDRLCGLSFRISPVSFYQVNPYMAERLYKIAMNMASLRPDDVAIDAYSGTGTIALIAASYGAGSVIGVESNPEAVKDAVENARMNGLGNVSFVNADASKYMKETAKRGERCSVLFLDPPRSGATEEFLAAAGRMAPDRIVYISCSPESLQRDLRYIRRFLPYRIRGIQPVDMFPGSEHIETVVLLSRIREKSRKR